MRALTLIMSTALLAVGCADNGTSSGSAGGAGATGSGGDGGAGTTTSSSSTTTASSGSGGAGGGGAGGGGAGGGGGESSLLAVTPPMGWNSWNRFDCDVSEELIRGIADTIVSSGMRDAGYEYVVIDDCWQVERDAMGTIVADPQRFPSGIPALASYVHSLGLKFGLYTDAGTQTCQGRPGSYGSEVTDANTYAAWGVDYVKVDWCHSEGLHASERYGIFRDAFQSTGRDILFSICNWGYESPWEWGPVTGQMWRTTGDIVDSWSSTLGILDFNERFGAVAGPGHWNDPDMLEVGNGGMTATEYRAHMSLWSMMAAPLIAGNDIRTMSAETLAILTNREVIAVDQDPAGVQGGRVWADPNGHEVWSKLMSTPGTRAVALFNRSDAPAEIEARWSDIGLAPGTASVRDLWAGVDRGDIVDGYRTLVEAHGVVLLGVNGAEATLAAGDTYVSDAVWAHATSGWGVSERDRSNGEAQAGDGRPIQIQGHTYTKGIGVNAPAQIILDLDGRCTQFHAEVGLDDEIGDNGSVVFQVWADGTRLYDSGRVTGAEPARLVDVDITGQQELRLIVTGSGDDVDFDHADWANALVRCQ